MAGRNPGSKGRPTHGGLAGLSQHERARSPQSLDISHACHIRTSAYDRLVISGRSTRCSRCHVTRRSSGQFGEKLHCSLGATFEHFCEADDLNEEFQSELTIVCAYRISIVPVCGVFAELVQSASWRQQDSAVGIAQRGEEGVHGVRRLQEIKLRVSDLRAGQLCEEGLPVPCHELSGALDQVHVDQT